MKIPLRKKGGEIVAEAVVDPEFHEQLSVYKWHLYRGYAARTLRSGSKVLMHREILGAKPRDGLEVHHENGDRLDNRKANLVRTTKAEHQHFHAGHGVSGLRGVRPASSSDRWVARATHRQQKIHLGTFDTPEEASRVVEAWWERMKTGESQPHARLA